MRSRTVLLLSLFIAALTGLLFYTSQNQRISTQKQNRQTPSKVSSETPTQISNPCAKNTIKDKKHSPIISQIPNSEKADLLFEQGKEQRNTYQYNDALITFEEALKLYQKEQNFDKEALTLGTIGTVYHNKACYKTAIDYHEKRLGIANKVKDSKKEKAAAFSGLGDAYYVMGSYPKARDYYKKSWDAADEKDGKARAIALGGLGSVYLSLGNYPQAINHHMERLKLIDKILEKNQELTKEERKELFKLRGAALGSLGNAHHMQASYEETKMDRQKSYEKAMKYYEDHLKTATAKDNEDKPGEAIALGELASAYHSRWKRNGFKKDSSSNQTINCYEVPSKNDSDLRQAIDCYDKRLHIAQKIINDSRLVASTYGGLGGIYYSIGNRKPSKENYIADLKYSEENYVKAINFTTEYLTTSERITDGPGIGSALNLLGVSYFQISNIFKKQGKWLEENGQATEAKQKIIKSQENLDTAIQHLKDAISARESLREGLTETEKVFIFDTQQTTYLNLQQVYISNEKHELALEVAERGRARAFVDVLAEQLKTNREESAILNIQDIKRIAQEQQATLVIYSNITKQNSLIDHSHRLYIWVVKPNQEKVDFEKVNLEDWEEKLNKFRNELPEGDRPVPGILGGSMPRAYLRSSKKEKDKSPSNKIITQEEVNKVLATYYQILIEPNNNIVLPTENEKVIFVPQGSLFQIPFAALYDSKAKKYLIEKHPILTTPSIQALDIIRKRQQNRESNRKTLEKKDWLILGVKNAKPDQFCSNSEKLSLTELEGAEKEAEDISVLFDISPTLGVQEKTETAVKQKMLQARMIHLATHGLLDSCQKEVKEDAEIPGSIALNASGNDDGWLTASEISQMKLQAELIVLSACDTALGRLTADGVIGLSRSAISAGASSAIVSLWSVDDYSTAFLMTEFYRQLKEQSKSGKLDKAEALRQAMLNTKNYVDKDTKKKIYSEPYQWSAFTLVGEATTQLEKRQQ